MRRLTLILATIGLIACGSDKATAPATIVGTYTLNTIGGAAPPANVALGSSTITVTGGTIVFRSDGTFTETLAGTSGPNHTGTSITTPEPGTYTTQGDAVVLAYDDGSDPATGSWAESSVNLVEAGYALVYKR